MMSGITGEGGSPMENLGANTTAGTSGCSEGGHSVRAVLKPSQAYAPKSLPQGAT
jgi:hypothetical protein